MERKSSPTSNGHAALYLLGKEEFNYSLKCRLIPVFLQKLRHWSLYKVKSTAMSLFLDMFQYWIVWTFLEVYNY